MSRFARASHVIWHCQYHLVWVPKYRFRMLQGSIGREVQRCVMTFCQQLGCEIVEVNVQSDHVHLLVKVPPRLAISDLMGVLKGRTAIRLFNVFPSLRKKPYWGNHFWAKGYCVDTVGLNSEMIQKYVEVPGEGGTPSGAASIGAGSKRTFSEGPLSVPPSGGASGKTAFYELGLFT